MISKKDKGFCFCCEHHVPNLIFIGILLFAMGVMLWASEIGVIPPRFFWPITLMVLGVVFVFKALFVKK